MYYNKKHYINNVIGIVVSIPISIYLLYASIALVFIGIATIINELTIYSAYTISQMFYIGAFFFISTALLSLRIINKKNWPTVDGKIIDLSVVLNPIPLIRLTTMKITYTFYYHEKQYVKKTYSTMIFNTENDAYTYLNKNIVNKNSTIPVYVFKFYPKLSTHSPKMNIYYLFLFYLIILITSMVTFFGFIYRVVSIANLPTISNPSANPDLVVGLKHLYNVYMTNFDVSTLIAPGLLLFLILLFITLSLKLIIKNKIFFFYTRLDTDSFMEKITAMKLTEKHCIHCNYVNDAESKFCANCGKITEFY